MPLPTRCGCCPPASWAPVVAGALSMVVRLRAARPSRRLCSCSPVMTTCLGYLIALAAGAVAGMLLLGLLKKKKVVIDTIGITI